MGNFSFEIYKMRLNIYLHSFSFFSWHVLQKYQKINEQNSQNKGTVRDNKSLLESGLFNSSIW